MFLGSKSKSNFYRYLSKFLLIAISRKSPFCQSPANRFFGKILLILDKQELDAKVEEIAKALLSYCSARTSNHFEAEDLAQDIILEIYKSSSNIRNVDAVYGFMWAVAGNVSDTQNVTTYEKYF